MEDETKGQWFVMDRKQNKLYKVKSQTQAQEKSEDLEGEGVGLEDILVIDGSVYTPVKELKLMIH
jgi:hypothetical protein